ncbi:hypothetical protein CEXT_776511 [Caerostris extrusa]|uniref:Uncharacterized protein n=1 Tax=Caerostris extrusa TaxID=172846 RepID=A0AAV4TRA0_CAEEX|nr:hypothetical protein CEXT_776511 [Caerostris extrusa]
MAVSLLAAPIASGCFLGAIAPKSPPPTISEGEDFIDPFFFSTLSFQNGTIESYHSHVSLDSTTRFSLSIDWHPNGSSMAGSLLAALYFHQVLLGAIALKSPPPTISEGEDFIAVSYEPVQSKDESSPS